MNMKSRIGNRVAPVRIVDPKTINMSQALPIVVMKLKLQIEEREDWIELKRRKVLQNRFNYGKEFRNTIKQQMFDYGEEIEYMKTQLLLLGNAYGQN